MILCVQTFFLSQLRSVASRFYNATKGNILSATLTHFNNCTDYIINIQSFFFVYCFFISRISQITRNGFLQNLVEGCAKKERSGQRGGSRIFLNIFFS